MKKATKKVAAKTEAPKGGDTPGRELAQANFREVAQELVNNQGWRYDVGRKRGGHPTLYPVDPAQAPLSVPTTPSDHRAFRNWLSDVRRRGGMWPSAKKGGE